MKRTLTLIACLSLAVAGCDKKKSDSGTKPAPAGSAAAGSAAPGSAAAGSAAPGSAAAGSAAPGSAAAAPSGDGLKLPRTEHKVGDKVTEVTTQDMAITAEVGPGKTVDVKQTGSKTELKETMAVDGGVVTKLKIGYSAMTESQTMGGKTEDKPSPLAGKTYLVWREGDEVKVSNEDGSAPSAEEIKAVAKDNKSIGKPEPMEDFVSSRTWKVGEKVEPTADELVKLSAGMSGGADGAGLKSLAMTLQSVDGNTATWTMAMTMVVKEDTAEMQMEMTGTAKAELANGRLLEIAMTGPFSGISKVKMTGTVTMKTVNTY